MAKTFREAAYPIPSKQQLYMAGTRAPSQGTPSPDTPWKVDDDLSVASNKTSTESLGGAANRDTLEASGVQAAQASYASYKSLLQAWDVSWFGCQGPESSAPEVGIPSAPHRSLATYGSLLGRRDQTYLSTSGADPGAQFMHSLMNGNSHQSAVWGSQAPEPAADAKLAVAYPGLASSSYKTSNLSQHSQHSQQLPITSSTVSPQNDSDSPGGVLNRQSYSVPSDVHAVLQPSSSHGELGSSPVVATHSLSDTYIPPEASAAADTRRASAGSSSVHAPQHPSNHLQPAILGTWVSRQYRLLDRQQEQHPQEHDLQGEHSRSQPDSIANSVNSKPLNRMRSVHSEEPIKQVQSPPTLQPPVHTSPFMSAANQPAQPQQVPAPTDSRDAAMHAAWRWRFTRRWHAEQQRTAAEDAGAASPDKIDEAMAYLAAGGGQGWNMQVACPRTTSTDASGLHSVGTHGNGSLLAGEMLLDDGSYTAGNGLARAASKHPHGDSATRQINSVNRRALHLLEQQCQLERQAEERWNTSLGSDNWLGHHMATVEIDDWGTFKFVVVRIRGRNDKQRILVRGRNYCSEAQIVEDINRKMVQLAGQKNCTTEHLEVMGGGVMEWRRERDRHLHLHSGFTCTPHIAVAQPATWQEILNLAAVLTKQHLPVHFKVSIQGQA